MVRPGESFEVDGITYTRPFSYNSDDSTPGPTCIRAMFQVVKDPFEVIEATVHSLMEQHGWDRETAQERAIGTKATARMYCSSSLGYDEYISNLPSPA